MAPTPGKKTRDFTSTECMTIIIADHDPCASQRIQQLLRGTEQYKMLDIRTVANCAALHQIADKTTPHAILLNPKFGDARNEDALDTTRRLFPDAAVLLLTTAPDPDLAARVLAADGDAILTLNDALPHVLLPALQQALAARQARRCCRHLADEVKSLQENLARNQAAPLPTKQTGGPASKTFSKRAVPTIWLSSIQRPP
ncbi:MAG: response regulator transcription factor [Phycisphaerae bacterium]|nr:response regulator transcription factor [Phycisphaerae bacterium]